MLKNAFINKKRIKILNYKPLIKPGIKFQSQTSYLFKDDQLRV